MRGPDTANGVTADSASYEDIESALRGMSQTASSSLAYFEARTRKARIRKVVIDSIVTTLLIAALGGLVLHLAARRVVPEPQPSQKAGDYGLTPPAAAQRPARFANSDSWRDAHTAISQAR